VSVDLKIFFINLPSAPHDLMLHTSPVGPCPSASRRPVSSVSSNNWPATAPHPICSALSVTPLTRLDQPQPEAWAHLAGVRSASELHRSVLRHLGSSNQRSQAQGSFAVDIDYPAWGWPLHPGLQKIRLCK